MTCHFPTNFPLSFWKDLLRMLQKQVSHICARRHFSSSKTPLRHSHLHKPASGFKGSKLPSWLGLYESNFPGTKFKPSFRIEQTNHQKNAPPKFTVHYSNTPFTHSITTATDPGSSYHTAQMSQVGDWLSSKTNCISYPRRPGWSVVKTSKFWEQVWWILYRTPVTPVTVTQSGLSDSFFVPKRIFMY